MMARKTVADMLDDYHAKKITLDQLADYIRNAKLAQPPATTAAQLHGIADAEVPGDNEWGTVDQDPQLTSDEYAVLAAAHNDSLRK